MESGKFGMWRMRSASDGGEDGAHVHLFLFSNNMVCICVCICTTPIIDT